MRPGLERLSRKHSPCRSSSVPGAPLGGGTHPRTAFPCHECTVLQAPHALLSAVCAPEGVRLPLEPFRAARGGPRPSERRGREVLPCLLRDYRPVHLSGYCAQVQSLEKHFIIVRARAVVRQDGGGGEVATKDTCAEIIRALDEESREAKQVS